MADRKFTKLTFTVTFLIDELTDPNTDLRRLIELEKQGPVVMDCSREQEALTPKQMADALCEARSEPGFFELDDDG
jgi:hypothetical protein